MTRSEPPLLQTANRSDLESFRGRFTDATFIHSKLFTSPVICFIAWRLQYGDKDDYGDDNNDVIISDARDH